MTISLSIVIPCYELKQHTVAISILANGKLFSKYPVIVVNKGGGNLFKKFAKQFLDQDTDFWVARKFGLKYVRTKYVLCLDVDTILPDNYVEQAIDLLEKDQKIGAIALNYDPLIQDHLAFGTSIWRTKELKKLYDWKLTSMPSEICECKYMWNKLTEVGLKVETLPMNAMHINIEFLRNIGVAIKPKS